MAKRGRPTEYNEELAKEICRRISDGESVRSIARDPKMPAASTIFDWAIHLPVFSEQYEKARDVGLEVRAEEIEDIAADTTLDTQRAKLITDVKRWNMSKLKPKRFGDKIDVTSGGDKLPSSIIQMTDAQLESIATGGKTGTG